MRVFHGTSSLVAEGIVAGSRAARPVYVESNISLGGTYVTADHGVAATAAQLAARTLGGRPCVLVLELNEDELLPDEDWIVRAAESPEEVILDPRIEVFLQDAFRGYPGEGHSLSDHYATRYDELNRQHRISWRDSWAWAHTARLARLIRASDLVSREDLRD